MTRVPVLKSHSRTHLAVAAVGRVDTFVPKCDLLNARHHYEFVWETKANIASGLVRPVMCGKCVRKPYVPDFIDVEE